MIRRIPFLEAISEPLLFKARFEGLSRPQQVALKVLNGCELTPEELPYWSMFQEAGTYDELGYAKSRGETPYIPRDYREAWIVVGRRGSKTDAIAATQVAYEAICGGHEDHVRKGQRALCFQIAQDLRMARYSLHFINAALESSPLGRKLKTQVTADRIDLANNITVAVVPPTLKSVRGYACPIAVMDEVGVWYQESDSANPDYEIYRALSPGQLQFPHRKIVGISTPWNKAGLLYKFYSAGTRGSKLHFSFAKDEFEDMLVLHAPTAAMENPLVTREFLERERNRDPKAFERECLAVFQDSISGFLPTALIERATDRGVVVRTPEPRLSYVCAIDPAFRRDAFGLSLVHRDEKGDVVVDGVKRWLGTSEQPLDPKLVLYEIRQFLRPFGVDIVFSDQYHLESFSELALQQGITVVGVPFTSRNKAEMFGNLQQLFHQGRIRLVDDAELLKELRMLERALTGQTVKIGAPPGFHDDLATTLCMAAAQAVNLYPEAVPEKPRPPTLQERCRETLLSHREVPSTWD